MIWSLIGWWFGPSSFRQIHTFIFHSKKCPSSTLANHQPISDQITDGPSSYRPKLLLHEYPREKNAFLSIWTRTIFEFIYAMTCRYRLIVFRWSFLYLVHEKGVLIWFQSNPRNFRPCNLQFRSVFLFETLFAPSFAVTAMISKRGIFLHIFLFIQKVCRGMFTHSNAHAKVQNLIFGVQLPGNWFEFGIFGNDFWSSTIGAVQIHVSIIEFENPKNLGIKPTHNLRLECKPKTMN